MPLTFAYGSNMDYSQMINRCPSAKFICIALLNDYRLAFPRRSIKKDCGVASVVPENGKSIWGVVYQISGDDLKRLDSNEGYQPDRSATRNAYNRRSVIVRINGDPGSPVNAEVYFATPQENPSHLPNQDYKNQIVNGAKYWNLPDEYISELEQIEVS